MNELLERGLVREIGCSNFSAAQLDEAAGLAAEQGLRDFAVVENEYSLFERAPEGDDVLGVAPAGSACRSSPSTRSPPACSAALTGAAGRRLAARASAATDGRRNR